MIIHAIRLKNIKSYGEGVDGTGVTVSFQDGVNRIAGRNGNGKTTLIEALGYALFLCEPQFEENFQTATYFLRHGAKAGEIDVTFSENGDTYRIERGLGPQSKRRTKVVLTADESICAEGDDEVAKFLCRMLKFPEAERLREMFTKLIGVKQGRLTWPFDSKAAAAKSFFEPLLDVAIFRECFEGLKPAGDQFQKLVQDATVALSAVEQKIADRADSIAQRDVARAAVIAWDDKLNNAQAALAQAREKLKSSEQLERAATEAKSAKEKSEVAVANTKKQTAEAEKRVAESQAAAETVKTTMSAFEAYKAAEAKLKDLETQRRVRDDIQKKRDQAEGDRKDRIAKAVAARDQAKVFDGQVQDKTQEQQDVAVRLQKLQQQLEASTGAYEEAQQAAKVAENDFATGKAWINGLTGLQKRFTASAKLVAGLGAEIAAWDLAKLEDARIAEQECEEKVDNARQELAQAQQRHKSLEEQLSQISGGVCPFLKETCKQFNPGKVQQDLTALAKQIQDKQAAQQAAVLAHNAATKVLQPLDAAEKQLGPKKSQWQSEVQKCREEMASLLPADVEASVDRLRAWAAAINPLPAATAFPGDSITLESLANAQRELDEYVQTASVWWNKAASCVQDGLATFKRLEQERMREENAAKTLSEQFQKLNKEIADLSDKAKTRQQNAQKLDVEAATFQTAVTEYDDKLKPFVNLTAEIGAEQDLRDQNRGAYEQHLIAQKLADDLSPRQTALQQCKEDDTSAVTALESAVQKFQEAKAAFDPQGLADAKKKNEECAGAVKAAETNLENARKELKKEEARFLEWEIANKEGERIREDIERNQAASALTELARKTLRDTAPAVAQHVCDRIAAKAQGLFNQINPEPVQMAWDAKNYSLRITPGDRRFAMLSGGEQTKIALTLTLAMIEAFSNLRFCIFDEPTYGVDADSRSKLADAILAAQSAANLDQLLLVSHDDAFEGKIEHAILLQKSSASGSAVSQTQ